MVKGLHELRKGLGSLGIVFCIVWGGKKVGIRGLE